MAYFASSPADCDPNHDPLTLTRPAFLELIRDMLGGYAHNRVAIVLRAAREAAALEATLGTDLPGGFFANTSQEAAQLSGRAVPVEWDLLRETLYLLCGGSMGATALVQQARRDLAQEAALAVQPAKG
jgi:hypothetical protein